MMIMAVKFKRFAPTEYVMKVKKGKVVQEGLGLAFFYDTMTTSMLVMPAMALDSSFAFDDIMTSDFQAVNIQGDITYIINNYEKASKMVDFFYKEKEYKNTLLSAKTNMTKRITNLAKVMAVKFISEKNIKSVLKCQ